MDNVTPQVNISYAAVQEGTTVHYLKADKTDAESFSAAERAYFNGAVKATTVVDEENYSGAEYDS